MKALEELYQKKFGAAPSAVSPLKGDGSGRTLYRLSGKKGTAVGALALDRSENVAFLEFSRHFRKNGLPVPEIYAEDLDANVYLEEDLGDTPLFKHLTDHRSGAAVAPATMDVYRKVVGLLPKFQMKAGRTLDYSKCYPRDAFDKQSMMWDLNYFKYYFLRLAPIPFSEQSLEDDYQKFTDYLLEADRDYFLYRDFQSRNVMVQGGEPWFIDYQGGRKGALQYDIASLLFDAKADLPFPMRAELLELYIKEAGVDRAKFMRYYPGYVFIRIMQAMGAYGLRGFYERKPHFLQSIPYAIRNIEHLLQTYELPVKVPALQEVFRRLVASSQLRQFGTASLALTVRVQSFSFKKGAPQDDKGHGGGFVFDCRALPNPGKYPDKYGKSTGRDKDVIDFLEKEASVKEFLGNVFGLVDAAVMNYKSRNFTDLMVSFGCTGGQHRSVYCAELLARHLREKHGVAVAITHREHP